MTGEISATEAARRLEADPSIRLLDVRTPDEWEAARLAQARRLDEDLAAEILGEWGRDETVIVCCHHGIRSRLVAHQLRGAGFTAILNLTGGLEAWSREVDPELPRYQVCPGGGVRPVR
jgi:adenylyltransferase/sulfurtransferase